MGKPSGSFWSIRKNAHFLVFVGITFAVVASVTLFPFVYALTLSFKKMGMREMVSGTAPGVGFSNYVTVLTDSLFWKVVLQTLRFTFEAVILELVIAMGIATVMSKDFWGGSLLLTLVLLPWAVPPVVNGTMWRFLYNAKFGWVNGLLSSLGIIKQYITFLSEPSWIIEVVVYPYAWRTIPFSAIMLYAGLKTIPEELYDAARVDGANAVQQFRRITLPLLRPVLLVLLVLRTMFELRAFDEIFALTFGGPGDSSWVWALYIYMSGFRFFKFGVASVAAVLLGFFTMVLIFVYMRVFSERS